MHSFSLGPWCKQSQWPLISGMHHNFTLQIMLAGKVVFLSVKSLLLILFYYFEVLGRWCVGGFTPWAWTLHLPRTFPKISASDQKKYPICKDKMKAKQRESVVRGRYAGCLDARRQIYPMALWKQLCIFKRLFSSVFKKSGSKVCCRQVAR